MSDDGSLWAHSPSDGGQWHALEDHLRGTAELARRFAAPFGGGELAYWLGALHDVGKASCAWQEGLKTAAQAGGPVGIDHKALGSRIAFEHGLAGFALGIYGHHGGLIDGPTFGNVLKKRIAKSPGNIASAEAALADLLPDLPADLRDAVPEHWRSDPLVGEMALRLCYSALVDADWLDTEAHFRDLGAPRIRDDADFDRIYKIFEQRRSEALGLRAAALVDAIRERVYAECIAAAEQPPGVFRLPAPTGSGKTLAGAGFALRHAQLHGHRRVIVAVPFLTITEQNAAVYRQLLDEDSGDPTVLEHHSQANFDDGAAGRWGRLAAENWDAPFVVTTFVRLFESLFARKPAAMRRVHRLAGAVIVLDEVQALPHNMLAPILDGLRLLVRHFGTTVVLSSATQPAFGALKEFAELEPVDLVTDSAGLVDQLRRVRYEWLLEPAPTLAQIAERAVDENSAMVVVNTTADAQAVFDAWRDVVPEGVAWHLSTRMCPVHRQRTLAEVRRRLLSGRPVLLVSTQLIEAGVDVDFPVVFRAVAPADSLLQAAGRANRDGKLPQPGRVVVFAPADGGQPPAYKTLVGDAARFFGPDKADPDNVEALQSYYRTVYQTLNLADREHLGQRIQQSRQRWEFQTVAEGPLISSTGLARDRKQAFRLISDEGISVVTPQGAENVAERASVEALISDTRNAPVPDLRVLRRLQPYTTNLHPSVLRRPGVRALMRPILGGAEVKVGSLVEWLGDYDAHTGIAIDPDVEGFVL
ncbi:CRISPR-associated helicase Cas3' [Micromonospora zhanjiangensis]|uniref:CRISPR-associated helicase Cas3 n=1 Tax=Micromonospora zhanjiangensis TaxID=1522057 RepID=A0ABV8KPT5_9ACTN